MNTKWVKYKNGNYFVYFNTENGTKIRRSINGESFKPEFPENCDVMISQKCDMYCPWCYAGCTEDGKFGDFNYEFLKHMHPYTEMAINLNFPVHPELEEFLYRMKEQHVIVNITVNQEHLEKHLEYVKKLKSDNLFYGLGVSLRTPNEFIKSLPDIFDNVVLHVINGIFDAHAFHMLRNQNLKLLILGYKDFGRGIGWHNIDNDDITYHQGWLYNHLLDILNEFKLVSFDNLALEQLKVKRFLSEEEWNLNYMGDDGTMTFAINLVNGTFSRNSMSNEGWEIGNKTLEEMLQIVRER